MAGLARQFQKAVAKAAEVPWLMATEEDFRYPEIEGRRPAWMGLLNWYMGRVFELADSDRVANLRFYEVVHMLNPPMVLFAPPILFAVLFKGQHPGGSHDQPTEIDLRAGTSRQISEGDGG